MADRLSLERICLQLTVEKNLVKSRGRVLPRTNCGARYYGLKVEITNDTVSLKIGVDASGNTKSTQLVNNENTGGKKLSTSASFSSDGRYVVTSENSLGISTQTTWHNAETDHQVSYVYDLFERLVEEKYNGVAKYRYEYNGEGDLVRKREVEESTPFLSRTYTYGNSQWLDQLTGWDNHTISYDEAGNPLNWYSGEKDWSLSWEGKTLAGASSASGDTITFSYDMDRQRSRKVGNGVTHQYLMQGTNVVYDAFNGHCLEFIYDNVGQPYGFYYDGTPYYYVINQQGDVEKILNSQGSELVTYIYNAWGKPISIQDTSSNQIGSINPIRYRGYYYDSETGFSFLRYFSAAFFFCFLDASGREKGHRI